MVKNIAPSKQTGGGGFVFEDKVSAWFLANMLSANSPFNSRIGRIFKIDYQVRQDGWFLDDFLIYLKNDAHIISKVPVSVKSNTLQINSEGLDSALVTDLWTQFLNDLNGNFNKNTDYLCIVTTPLPQETSISLNKILTSAHATDSSTFYTRITNDHNGAYSVEQKKIFKSFECPGSLKTKHKVQDFEIVDLLKRILFLEFDFEASISKDEIRLKSICRDCLTNDSQQLLLYSTLIGIRDKYAPHSGQISYDELVSQINVSYSLKGYPNHAADWEQLKKELETKLSLLQDKIGGTINLNRENTLNEISSKFKQTNVIFLLGKSGYGKSVIGKKFIDKNLFASKKVIWLDANCFENGDVSKHLGLQNRVVDLIEKVQDPEFFLYIDGIDRFFKDSLTELSKVLMAGLNKSGCKVLISCQSDDFADVIERLYRKNLTFTSDICEVKPLDVNDISEIQKKYVQLNSILKQPDWLILLNNLKLLDLVVFNLSKIDVNTLLVESQIIDILWKYEIEGEEGNGDQNSVFLQLISEKQATELTLGIPKSSFSVADVSPLKQLKENKILYETNEKIYFIHDLFSDWARFKLIKANGSNFKAYSLSKDLASPLWCKAIRIYGNYLLEQSGNSVEWINCFNSLNSMEPKEKIIQDLLLESIIFSISPLKYLEALWPLLKAEEGAILKRLLDRFLIKATKPNKKVPQWLKEIKNLTVSEASTIHREIQLNYWPTFLNFIYNHRNEISELCRLKIISIAQKWLSETPLVLLYRKEMAEIALMNAEFIFNFKLRGGIVYEDLDKEIYRTLLCAYNELPEKVVELSLKLCRRIEFSKPAEETNSNDELAVEIDTGFKSLFRTPIKVEPWPDGPFERIDDDFCEVCLDTDSLYFLIAKDPSKAKEILLACIIDPPKKYAESYDSFHYKYDVHDPHKWHPPFYTRGPFLDFLRYQPIEAIDLILRLVNFVTQQWTKTIKKEEQTKSIEIKYEGNKKEYFGDYQVYFWFRDVGNAPHVVVSSLMSLEKFLYERIDDKQEITSLIDHILKNTNSLCVVGLLNAVGKYSPDLFLSSLKQFLTCPEILHWEMSIRGGARNIEGHQMIGSNFFDQKVWQLAKEWNEMPHRKVSVNEYAAYYYFNNKDIESLFNKARETWKLELADIEKGGRSDPFLDNLIAQFDKANYELIKEGDKQFYSYKEPNKIAKKLKDTRIQNNKKLDTLTFPFSCIQALEKNTKLTLRDAEQLWNKIQFYAKNGPSLDDDTRDSIFGAFAVLVNNKSIWSNAHPEYLEFIIKQSRISLLSCRITTSELIYLDVGYSWRSFMAFYLPILWNENRKNKHIRELIGLLVVKSSYDTLKTLATNISKIAGWSNPDFIQVQNLVIEYSLGMTKFHVESDRLYYESIKERKSQRVRLINKFKKICGVYQKFDINKYSRTILVNFINARTSSELIVWADRRVSRPKRKHQYWYNEETNMNEPGLDVEMLYHFFESLPQFDEKTNELEYAHIVNIYKQFIDQIVFELGDLDESGKLIINDFPRDSDLNFIKKITGQLLLMKEIDSQRLWMPIFEYGAAAHHWVESYCSYFMLLNIDKPERSKRLLSEWDKMIEYAVTSKMWYCHNGYKSRRDSQELWFALYCIRNPEIWDDNFPHFFPEAANRVLSWMSSKWFDQEIIQRLLLLLRKKNSILFIEKGIPLIQKFLEHYIKKSKETPPKGYVQREFEHVESLARTASFLWENQKNVLKGNTELNKSFKEIVTYLVSIQNNIGLDLQERILQE